MFNACPNELRCVEGGNVKIRSVGDLGEAFDEGSVRICYVKLLAHLPVQLLSNICIIKIERVRI